jgi:hypothetical protein
MTPEEESIIELYSFTESEQEVYPFARKYMRKIKPKLPQIVRDPATRERFMLAGLYTTYRAFKHFGIEMTTDNALLNTYLDNVYKRRLSEFRQITGKDIEDVLDYFRMVKYNPFKMILSPIIGIDVILYYFVIHGR